MATTCRHCNSVLESGDAFCGECGRPVSTTGMVPSTPRSVSPSTPRGVTPASRTSSGVAPYGKPTPGLSFQKRCKNCGGSTTGIGDMCQTCSKRGGGSTNSMESCYTDQEILEMMESGENSMCYECHAALIPRWHFMCAACYRRKYGKEPTYYSPRGAPTRVIQTSTPQSLPATIDTAPLFSMDWPSQDHETFKRERKVRRQREIEGGMEVEEIYEVYTRERNPQ